MTPSDLDNWYAGKRVLITGGLGFIGSNLAHRLVTAGAEVVLVDSLVPDYGGLLFNVAEIRDHLTINISDVRDEHSLRFLVKEREVLFNLAGQTSHLDSMTDPYTDLEINCRSQLSILEACRHENPGVKIVYASTRQIYGRPRYLPVDEDHPIVPVDVNGINKTSGEWFHLLYGDVYGMRTTALRLTNTFGPRMRVRDARQTFLGIWLRRALTGGEILVFGDGSQRRDLTYVDDAVEAFLLAGASEQTNGRVYNTGGKGHLSLLELAESVVRIAGSGSFRVVPFPADRKSIDIGDYYSDYGRIQQDIGWRPTISVEEGLKRTVDYYRLYGSEYWDA